MTGFIVRTIVTAVAVAIVAYVYPAIDYGNELLNLAVVAVVLGLVNAFVKPIVGMLSLPLNLMTFGLFGFVINAVLLLAVAAVTDALGFTFIVGGFPPDLGISAIVAAAIGSIAISIVSAVISMVVPD
jgi:putative membrane protein